MQHQNTLSYARELDSQDEFRDYRKQFYIPQHNGRDTVYFTGNSLGLQPKTARAALEQELTDWAELGVEGHFQGKNPWYSYHELLTFPSARLVGAHADEVVVMNTLTANLHLMLVSFYRPTQLRYKILTEGGAFPSDMYALESQVRYHGMDPDEVIVELMPRKGEVTLRTEDILDKIAELGGELALIMMGGVNYYTGQAFEMDKITRAGHEAGALVGFDLAHAAGNLVLKLHEWDVDFAVWCTYKYLNSGPGGTSGVFVHQRHGHNPKTPRFAGWWGHEKNVRFQMKKGFQPMPGAEGWQLSNAQIFPMALHKASLELFEEAGGMEMLRVKSEKLTGFLEFLLDELNDPEPHFDILTPRDPQQRGCQLSLVARHNGRDIFKMITEAGVIADWREPDVIRVAPVPLYNTYEDVFRFVELLKEAVSGAPGKAG